MNTTQSKKGFLLSPEQQAKRPPKHICEEEEYIDQNGWGIVKPVIDLKLIAPLCRHPYQNHPKGCGVGCKRGFWYDIVDPKQDVWGIWFSMNLDPLWDKLRKRHPHWSELQVRNLRYWGATRKKLLRKMERAFLIEHPGRWARVLDRAPKHINYTYGLWYDKTFKQIGVNIPWPPGPYPMLAELVGTPIRDNLAPEFILE